MERSIGATFVSSEKLLIVNHLRFALVFNLTMCVLNDSFLFNSLSRNSNNSKFTVTNTREIVYCTHFLIYAIYSYSSIYSPSLVMYIVFLYLFSS